MIGDNIVFKDKPTKTYFYLDMRIIKLRFGVGIPSL